MPRTPLAAAGIAVVAALTGPSTSLAEPVEAFLEAPGPAGPLGGTLLEPPVDGDGAPTAIVIPGSGPTDRNGLNTYGMKAATYRLLAEDLARRGVATLRIDKRGMFGSAGAISDPFDVTVGDYADDVAAWAKVLREGHARPCAWLIGHSEGALVALIAAARDPGPYCGLVLLAAPGRPIGEILRDQFRTAEADAATMAQLDEALRTMEDGESFDPTGLTDALRALLNKRVQPFLIDLLGQDPAALLRDIDLPTLSVSAAEDIQIFAEDARRLAAAGAHVETLTIAGANHMFKPVPPGDRAANMAAYMKAGLPLADGLTEGVATFIKRPRDG